MIKEIIPYNTLFVFIKSNNDCQEYNKIIYHINIHNYK